MWLEAAVSALRTGLCAWRVLTDKIGSVRSIDSRAPRPSAAPLLSWKGLSVFSVCEGARSKGCQTRFIAFGNPYKFGRGTQHLSASGMEPINSGNVLFT